MAHRKDRGRMYLKSISLSLMAAVGQRQGHLALRLGKALSLGLKMMFGLKSILRENDLIQRFIHIY